MGTFTVLLKQIPGLAWLLAAVAVTGAGLFPARLRRSSACACAAAAASDTRDTHTKKRKQ